MLHSFSISIKFDKANNTYKLNDFITGQVIVIFGDHQQKKQEIASLKWKSEGAISTQNKESNKELLRIAGNLNPIVIHQNLGDLTKEKQILQEKNTFQFKYQLTPTENSRLIETYVGVYVAVAYELQVELILNNGLAVRNSLPFYVQLVGVNKMGLPFPQDFNFRQINNFIITPEKLLGNQSLQNKQNVKFKIVGVMNTLICQFLDGLQGSLRVEECDSEIRTIDLQMIRVEKLENKLGQCKEATEIQLIQIMDGNITKGLDIPFHMIFPKFFSCPNFSFKEFSVDFEVNLVVILYDGFKITLNFPLQIIRK